MEVSSSVVEHLPSIQSEFFPQEKKRKTKKKTAKTEI